MLKNKINKFLHNFENKTPLLPLIVILLMLGSKILIQREFFSKVNPYLLLSIVQFIVYVIPSIIFSFILKTKNKNAFKIRRSEKHTFSFRAVSFLLLITVIALSKFLYSYITGARDSTIDLYSGTENMLPVIVSSVLLPSVFEEIFIHGILFSLYEERCGSVGAILATSIIFSVIHFSPSEFFTYFFAAFVIGVVVSITKSIFSAIVFHFLNNFLCLYFEDSIFKVASESKGAVLAIFLLCILTLVLLSLVFSKLETIFTRLSLTDEQAAFESDTQSDVRLCAEDKSLCSSVISALLSPVFIVCIIIYVIYIALFLA